LSTVSNIPGMDRAAPERTDTNRRAAPVTEQSTGDVLKESNALGQAIDSAFALA